MLKAIVVDDEKDAVGFIKSIINEYCENIEVAGEANSADEAYEKIIELTPDIVFLDVEMPNGNGFDLLEKFSKIDFKVIFITAYDHYAIKAIKYSALDYILKPIDIAEFLAAIKKVEAEFQKESGTIDLQMLMENLQTKLPRKLAIPTGKGLEYVDTNDIIRIEADRSYSVIYIKGGIKTMVSRGLKEFQELLIDRHFFRTHNSHLINLSFVKLFSKRDGGFIKMIDDALIPISRSKKELFAERMKSYSLNLKSK